MTRRYLRTPAEIRRAEKKAPVLPVRILRIEIRAGDDTCLTWWDDPEKRCPHIVTSHMGTRSHCGVFGGALDMEPDKPLQRVPQCLAAEEK